jgi:hypothetical protein
VPILRAGIGMLDIIPNAKLGVAGPRATTSAAARQPFREGRRPPRSAHGQREPADEGRGQRLNVSVASGICLDEALRQPR